MLPPQVCSGARFRTVGYLADRFSPGRLGSELKWYLRLMKAMNEALKALRIARGLTQPELSARIREKTERQIGANRLCEWERGKSFPSLYSLHATLIAMDTDFHGFQNALDGKLSLFGEDENEPIMELGYRRLKLDPSARQRIRETFQLLDQIQEFMREPQNPEWGNRQPRRGRRVPRRGMSLTRRGRRIGGGRPGVRMRPIG